MQANQKAEKTFNYLESLFKEAKTELNFSTPFETLVAVILSAQCTDKRVNEVTAVLFKKYNTPKDFANLKQEELEKMIYSLGFYHNKAKNIIKMSNQILNDYNGELPKSSTELQKLAGVGRKTANVVSSIIFDENVMGVDTHIFRVLNRIGLTCQNTPEKTEKEFSKKYPNYLNHDAHYRLVLFGRYHCTARNPKCNECELCSICKFYKKGDKNVYR
ncbi:MAG: endonuclease III [Clostridia bacterium]|nr:endonuclease III [Clostridia bacterium]